MGVVVLPLLRILALIYIGLPRSMQIGLGRALGSLLSLWRPRATVVRENLLRAFPGQGEAVAAQRKSLEDQAYQHLGQLAWEILMVLGPKSPLQRWLLRYTKISGVEQILQACREGHGAIVLASHVGNWEILSAMGAQSGMDLMIVTKKLSPQWMHEAAESGRQSYGVAAAYEPKTMRKVLAHLRRHGAVGFVLDQYAGPPIGVRVPFFGIPVGTPGIIATLAKRTGAKVFPALSYRGQDGNFYCQASPALPWISDPDPKREIALNTAQYSRVIEQQVRAYPDQWIWTHRRFKGDLSPLRNEEWSSPRQRH